MSGKLIYPYTEALLQYEFKDDHPLKPDRLFLTYELSRLLGLLKHVKLIEPTMPTREDLESFHSPEFIDAVIESGTTQNPKPEFGLGTMDNPVFPNLYDAAARYVGATLDAMKAMMKGVSEAFVISGGLHHSHERMASGFCIFNDVVVAIKHLQKQKASRILYLDIDAHHGDGVQNAFYGSKDVLTISIHQHGNTLFPGSGFPHESGTGEGMGHAVNIPVLPGAGSGELIRSFDEIVVPLFDAFKPDLLVTQLGVDAHFLDPLAQLSYSTRGYEYVLGKLRKMAEKKCKIGWLAVGGGGYHPVNVARLWTLFLSLMLDKKLPTGMPDSFIQLCKEKGYSNFPRNMRDEGEVVQGFVPIEQVRLDLDRVIRQVKEKVFPWHGLA
ncbi:MAG: acetoin utilization protein AcuC [Candidatus Thorarchaeota archaeon]|jgi:acetoin utilization protein AcuC